MKQIKYFAASSALAFLPFVAAAQQTGPATSLSSGNLTAYMNSILSFINNAVIPFILGVAFLIFVFGMFQYFIAGGANEEAREKGKSLLIYAILGFVLIIIFWGIINLLGSATGLQNSQLDQTLVPSAPAITNPGG